MTKTFSMISLGCPRNLVDSEYIISEFEKKGYSFKDSAMGVDTVVINTCSFIEDAKKESIDVILKAIDAKKDGAVKRIVVAGCLPERYGNELSKDLKEIDEFRGVLGLRRDYFQDKPARLTPGHYAYIKISEGCRNRCSYCIIPYLKGAYKSRGIESIVREARHFIRKGAGEIILVGQDTSLYGMDLYGRRRLPELLKRLGKVCEGKWLRLLYCHPANLTTETIKVIRDTRSICKYIDLPLEHINSRILRRMRRKVGRAYIVSLIGYIRRLIPEAAIRTSLIVGFPGETEEDFKELLSFIEDTRFERLGLFRYSWEEGTPAYRFKGHVSEKVKDERFDRAMLLQQQISREINEGLKGRILKVLVEEEDMQYVGRTEYDAPDVDGAVYVKGKGLKAGAFYDVRITDTYEYDLTGEVI